MAKRDKVGVAWRVDHSDCRVIATLISLFFAGRCLGLLVMSFLQWLYLGLNILICVLIRFCGLDGARGDEI